MADRFARTADRVAACQDERAEELTAKVHAFVLPGGGERALDAGTGAGALALALDERDRAAAGRAVDGVVVGPEELERATDEARDRVLPGADHTTRRARHSIELRVDGLTDLDRSIDAFAVGEGEGEPPRRLVPF